MGFKDKLNKILSPYVSDTGFRYIENSISNEELLEQYRGEPNVEAQRLKDLSSAERFAEKYVNELSNELFWLLRNEFVHNASNIKLAQGYSVESRIRAALKGIDVDMICAEHNSITCRICFGQSYENIPAGKTAAGFRKANAEIHACFGNSWEEREFLKERITEIQTWNLVDNPINLNPELRIKDFYNSFINGHRFPYNNKRGFEGEILVSEYIRSFVTDLYFNDDGLDAKSLSLSIEIETLYGKLFSYWIEYTNKRRGIKPSSMKLLLENMDEHSRINQVLEKQYADKSAKN